MQGQQEGLVCLSLSDENEATEARRLEDWAAVWSAHGPRGLLVSASCWGQRPRRASCPGTAQPFLSTGPDPKASTLHTDQNLERGLTGTFSQQGPEAWVVLLVTSKGAEALTPQLSRRKAPRPAPQGEAKGGASLAGGSGEQVEGLSRTLTLEPLTS